MAFGHRADGFGTVISPLGGMDDLVPEKRCRSLAAPAACFGLLRTGPWVTCLRPQIRTALFGVPRIMAHAELLWTKIQRQRLSADERSGCSDLAKPVLLAGHLPHYADLAPG